MKSKAKLKGGIDTRVGVDHSRWIFPATCFVYLASCAVMIFAARGDLWLDEIWSIIFAREAETPIDVVLLARLHHDNNHILNTMFLNVIGNQQITHMYRLLALVSGAGSLCAVALLAKRWGSLEIFLSVLLTGSSYPLLLYFSEARGYAPAILFGLFSYLLQVQNQRDFRLYRVPLFWITSILGMLSHLTFLIVSTALLLMSLARLIDEKERRRTEIFRLLLYHSPPFAFFLWLYLVFVHDMVTGGGPIYTYGTVIGQVAALALGFPQEPTLLVIAGICMVILLTIGAVTLNRNGDEGWVFYPFVLIVAPFLMLILTRPEYLYARYFIVCFPYFYLLLSRLLGLWWRSGTEYKRWSMLAILALLLLGHAHGSYLLLTFGRGNYSAALARIAESSPPGIVRIGSDHDLRNRTIIEFLAPANSNTKRLRYVAKEDWHREMPDWLLTHNQALSDKPPPEIALDGVGIYQFVEAYEFSGISGWNWFLYRREMANR